MGLIPNETPRWWLGACSWPSDGGISWWSIGVNLAGWSPMIYFLSILGLQFGFQPLLWPTLELQSMGILPILWGLQKGQSRVEKAKLRSKIAQNRSIWGVKREFWGSEKPKSRDLAVLGPENEPFWVILSHFKVSTIFGLRAKNRDTLKVRLLVLISIKWLKVLNIWTKNVTTSNLMPLFLSQIQLQVWGQLT